jgi:uncharacterized membrane protein YwzB
MIGLLGLVTFGASSLISLIVIVVIVGMVFWLLQSLPIAEPFRTVLYILCVIVAIIFLLQVIGIAL